MVISARLFIVIVVTLMLSGAHADAQSPDIVQVGSRVRFNMRDQGASIQAEVRAIARDSMTYLESCAACAPRVISRAMVTNLSMEVAGHGRIRRAGAGGVLGALGGGVVGVAAGANAAGSCHDGPCGAAIIEYAPKAAVGGAVLGALIGWFTAPKRWVPAELPGLIL